MGCHRFRIDLFEKSLNKRIWWWWRWWIMVWSPEKSTAILIPVSCVSVCGGPTLEIPNQIPHTPWGKMELKSAQFHGFYHFCKNNKIDQNIRTQKCDFLSTWFWVGSYNESYSAVSTIVNDIEFSRDHVKGPERPNLKNSYLKTSKLGWWWCMLVLARKVELEEIQNRRNKKCWFRCIVMITCNSNFIDTFLLDNFSWRDRYEFGSSGGGGGGGRLYKTPLIY